MWYLSASSATLTMSSATGEELRASRALRALLVMRGKSSTSLQASASPVTLWQGGVGAGAAGQGAGQGLGIRPACATKMHLNCIAACAASDAGAAVLLHTSCSP